jgi:cholesterol oxidase
VRAAVCAQFPVYLSTSVLNRVKVALHTADLFRDAGIGGVSPDTRRSVADTALDVALHALPVPAEERCGQAVCRWINAIYGMTHCHARLNDATHRAVNEMFGFGNVESLEHLSLMMGKGLAVTHTGGMDYFEHPERVARTPILLLQGTRNYIFHPAGTLKTLRWLQRSNPGGDYHRELLPGYAHLDAIIGASANRDVYPRITEFLDPR